MSIGTGRDPEVQREFLAHTNRLITPAVLELGTRRWVEDFPTHHGSWFPHAHVYLRSDVTAGLDVDQVADAHDLEPFDDEQFDAVLAVSVFEHLERPWRASAAIRRVLKPGGVAFVMTHQTFPVHGYPNDFYRFTREGLRVVLEEGGLEVLGTEYQYPAQIVPGLNVTRWNTGAEAWLNVAAYARR